MLSKKKKSFKKVKKSVLRRDSFLKSEKISFKKKKIDLGGVVPKPIYSWTFVEEEEISLKKLILFSGNS